MSKWLNNKIIIKENVTKPCELCNYCPYGQLVEEYPLRKNSKYSCELFGHDCPVYYLAEFVEEKK
jgi:transposase-like protein